MIFPASVSYTSYEDVSHFPSRAPQNKEQNSENHPVRRDKSPENHLKSDILKFSRGYLTTFYEKMYCNLGLQPVNSAATIYPPLLMYVLIN
jgi:hypothetical protein